MNVGKTQKDEYLKSRRMNNCPRYLAVIKSSLPFAALSYAAAATNHVDLSWLVSMALCNKRRSHSLHNFGALSHAPFKESEKNPSKFRRHVNVGKENIIVYPAAVRDCLLAVEEQKDSFPVGKHPLWFRVYPTMI